MVVTRWLGLLARSLARAASLATSRFPGAASFIVATAILANAEVAGHGWMAPEDFGWWIAAFYAGAAASVVVRLICESHGASPFLRTAAPILAAAGFAVAIRGSQDFGLFAPPLVAALTLAVFPAPFLARPDDRRFWDFTLWTSVGIALAFLSVLLFVLGISAILEMIRFLFEVGLSSRAYEHLYATALTLVGPLIALGRIPSDFDEPASALAEDRMAQGIRFLLDWVVAPLTLATALVLHLYAAKILALGTLPKNEVGWIVTFYAILVLSLRVAAEPFLEGGGAFTRAFGRIWAAMLVVPLGLLAIAIVERVGPEGWTLERYYLALGAMAAGAIVLLQIVPRLRGGIRLMVAIPVILLALSSIGPWSASDTVGRSQTARIAEVLGRAPAGSTLTRGDAFQIYSRIGALAEVNELARAADLVPQERRAEIDALLASRSAETEQRLAEALGASPSPTIEAAQVASVFAAGRETPFAVTGYDIALFDRTISRNDSVGLDRTSPILVEIDAADLLVTIDGAVDRFPMTELLAAVPAGATDADVSTIAPVDVDLDSASGKRLRLRVRSLWLVGAGGPPATITGTLLLRRSDWPAAKSF